MNDIKFILKLMGWIFFIAIIASIINSCFFDDGKKSNTSSSVESSATLDKSVNEMKNDMDSEDLYDRDDYRKVLLDRYGIKSNPEDPDFMSKPPIKDVPGRYIHEYEYMYIDLDSIKVLQDTDDIKEFTIDSVALDENANVVKSYSRTNRYLYQRTMRYSPDKIVICYYSNDPNATKKWRREEPDEKSDLNPISPGFLIGYREAFGKKFSIKEELKAYNITQEEANEIRRKSAAEGDFNPISY